VLTALALAVIAGIGARRFTTWRAERDCARRLPLGANGIIRGAESFTLEAKRDRAVLLLHGFGDTPQTLEYLAAFLHGQGWAVRAPLLPGHGRTLDAFAASRAGEWIDHARSEFDRLQARYETVAIVGQSMGGALATILASQTRDLQALVLLAPYLSMPTRLRRVANVHYLLGIGFPFLHGGGGERSIRDPAELARNLAYGFTTPRLVFELSRIVKRARAAAPSVSAPTLVIQSRQDHRIPPEAAERAFSLFTASERRLMWTEGNGHIITVDYGRQSVFAAVSEWLESYVRDARALRDAQRLAEGPRIS